MRLNREQGGISVPLVAVVVAAVAVGAVLVFIAGGSGGSGVQVDDNVGFKKQPQVPLEGPKLEERSRIEPKSEEATEILKGMYVKHHDRAGNVVYQLVEPVQGVDAQGRTLHFTANLTVMSPGLPDPKQPTKQHRKSNKTKSPPKMQLRNMRASPAAEQGEGDKDK
ncbi:MAG: hypothetical protein HY812_11635 [Planctomycetes bacterium]|nr:hypothetical protein [Planctomycetota bacterium]